MDENIQDYCETDLDQICPNSLEKSLRKIQHSRSTGFIRKKHRRKQKRRCCASMFSLCSRRKSFSLRKSPLAFPPPLRAPLVTLRDIFSTSFSIGSSRSTMNMSKEPSLVPIQPTMINNRTPQLSLRSFVLDRTFSASTPKSSIVHSYTSLSNYRLKSSSFQRNYSLEEDIHQEECPYCSSSSALSMKIDSNNNQFDQTSTHSSVNLFHAVEMYLSANPSLSEALEISSIASEQHTILTETKPLSLCEINQMIYAIHTCSETIEERNEILDALASSLREVAEETPTDTRVHAQSNAAQPEPIADQAEGLGQIVARAILYEIVMRLCSFYLFIFLCFAC